MWGEFKIRTKNLKRVINCTIVTSCKIFLRNIIMQSSKEANQASGLGTNKVLLQLTGPESQRTTKHTTLI